MRSWRFHPLRDFPRHGILISPEGRPPPARFLTPEQAKTDAIKRAQQMAPA